MFEDIVRPEIKALEAYVPGRSIEEIRQEYGIEQVVKMASNENPLGVSPRVQRTLADHAGEAFRYPAGGNPRLVKALASHVVDARGRHHDLYSVWRMRAVRFWQWLLPIRRYLLAIYRRL